MKAHARESRVTNSETFTIGNAETTAHIVRSEHSHEGEEHEDDHHLKPVELVRIALVALACAAVWFRVWEPFPKVSVIGIVAALIGMYPILKEALEAVLARRMTMELSMTIAIGAALAIGQFFTGLVIVLFVLIAEVLEGLTVGQGRRAIKDLLDFLPRSATVRRAGNTRDVNANEIAIDDRDCVAVSYPAFWDDLARVTS